jgi:hypothetical protein
VARTLRTSVRVCAATLLMLVAAQSTQAQLVQAPRRSDPIPAPNDEPSDTPTTSQRRGREPREQDQELIFTGSVLAGQNESVETEVAGVERPYTAFTDAELRYRRGVSSSRSFELGGRTYLSAYPAAGVDPEFGGAGTAHAIIDAHRFGLDAAGTVRYDPFVSLGTFTPVRGGADINDVPDDNPLNAVSSDSSLAFDGNLGLSYDFTPRNQLSGRYDYHQQTYGGSIGYDNHMQTAQGGYRSYFTRAWSAAGTYRYSQQDFGTDVSELTTQSVYGSVQYERRISRTRQVMISGAVGAEYIEGLESQEQGRFAYWSPAVEVIGRMDLVRTWALWADYRRETAVLDYVSLQSFPSHTVYLRTSGQLSRRFGSAAQIGYATGKSGVPGEEGRYRNITGSAQLTFAISRCCEAALLYNLYDYLLTGVAAPESVLPDVTRQSVQGGMTITFPFISRRSSSRTPTRRGRS